MHEARIEARVRGIEGMPEVTWARVQQRKAEYQTWSHPRLVLDTSQTPVNDLVADALAFIRRAGAL
ncbi:MAG: hypothetical protein AAFP81_08995 [Pseudomonadota bacterium]